MKIECEKDALLEGLQAALRAVPSRPTMPILGGIAASVVDGALELSATDLEMFLQVKTNIPCKSELTFVAPGKLLVEVIRSFEAGRITLEVSVNELKISGGKSDFSLNTLVASDFPKPPEVISSAKAVAGGEDLARVLRQVVRAASTDEARPVLTGVLWAVTGNELRLEATDSYRVAAGKVIIKESSTEAQAIIPGRVLAEVARQVSLGGTAEADLSETQARFVTGNAEVVTRLIDGTFPDWRKQVPSVYENVFTAPREALLTAVSRMGLVADVHTPVKMHLGDEVQLTVVESGVAQASEVLEGTTYNGKEMVVGFNPRFLSEGLDAFDGDTITLELTEPTRPATLKGEGDDFTYVVMPVRLPAV